MALFRHVARSDEVLVTLGDMAPRATQAEVAFLQQKNCLINLPRPLVAALLDSQTARLTGNIRAASS